MGKPVGSSLDLRQISTPATPAAGLVRQYVKFGNGLYLKGSDGVERRVIDNTTGLEFGATMYELNSNLKHYVRVATTANITLSGTQTIDGVSVIAGDRVLVKDQTTQANNGIYVVSASGWTRDNDMFVNADPSAAIVGVTQGSTQAGSIWITDSWNGLASPIGTASMVWKPLGLDGSYTPVLTAATTNPTMGTGSIRTGRWTRWGFICAFSFQVYTGSSGFGVGSGQYAFSLPFTAQQYGTVVGHWRVGTGNPTPWLAELSPGSNTIAIKKWSTTAGNPTQNYGSADGANNITYTCSGTFFLV